MILKLPKHSALVPIEPNSKVRLQKIDTADTGRYDAKEDTLLRLSELKEEIAEWQEKLYAEGKQSLLIVLQAMDTGGKDGAVKSLLTGVNPAGVQVSGFKAPSTLELAHDFLWRIHQATPRKGYIGVWNRSHYEDVLVAKVHKLADSKTIERRYRAINDFERNLVENGTTILKFYLHISKEEQRQRLQARLDNPSKHWKFNMGDIPERALWSEYQKAYEAALENCSTEYAPWYVVPADKKWSRDILLAEATVAAFRQMKPDYPETDLDVKKIKLD
jgi:PPK2 family polyphosphate:nucleotide phosphotransferase